MRQHQNKDMQTHPQTYEIQIDVRWRRSMQNTQAKAIPSEVLNRHTECKQVMLTADLLATLCKRHVESSTKS